VQDSGAIRAPRHKSDPAPIPPWEWRQAKGKFAHAYRRSRKDRRHSRSPQIPGLDKQRSAVATAVLAGRYVETSLELLRVVHLNGCTEYEVLQALGEALPAAWHHISFSGTPRRPDDLRR